MIRPGKDSTIRAVNIWGTNPKYSFFLGDNMVRIIKADHLDYNDDVINEIITEDVDMNIDESGTMHITRTAWMYDRYPVASEEFIIYL